MMPMPSENQAYATMGQMMDNKMAPQKANLRPADNPRQSCQTCAQFQPPNQCAIVAGMVQPTETCDQWSGENTNTGQEMSSGNSPT